MNKFTERSAEIEIMDDLNCSGEVVNQTLRELEVINRLLGGNAITLRGVSVLSKNKQTITLADLGCGGGDILKLIAAQFRKEKKQARLTGVDANPNIIRYAESNSKAFPEITYQAKDILSPEFRSQRFDVVVATLFFHHFTNDQLVEILSSLRNQVSAGIVINDLHRHPVAYYSIKWLTALFSKSAMVKYDGPLSVRRGFKRREILAILHEAGVANFSLRWKWAFRWEVIIRT